MRHRKRGRKLGRTSSHRKALFRNQATALFEHEQIRTTIPKCKELRRVAEKLITLAKKGDLPARRQAAKMLYGTNLHYKPARGENPTALDKHAVLRKLFDDIAPRYQDRNGGYTRIIRGELRKGDGTQMGYIQLV
ncbi:50S ribosomal protein L17 [Candidatus Poribacteria bacterium]|nr:50S ribosomal protein L17 [Candidatus Poribacteria bacterium]MYH79758.1 50S ribosomal protein L17 [Candidatus Poribacteria bacterium]MYK96578.1 50S ribosomal protein L17 [Candidatus Poribacteria bacterium]